MSKHPGRPIRLPGVPLTFSPPGVDLAETALRHIEAEADTNGWDQPTDMYWLYNRTDGLLLTRPPLRQFLSRMYPPAMMDLVGATMHRARWSAWSGLYGIVVVFEAWTVTADKSKPGDWADKRADAEARRIEKRADRVETRNAILATVSGETWLAHRVRSEDLKVNRVDDDGEGVVVEALRRLVRAAVKHQTSAAN